MNWNKFFGFEKRSTHVVQALYLTIVLGCYAYTMYVVYTYVPSGVVSELQIGIVTILLIASLFTFAVACISDPGFITPDNVELYSSSFPRDQVLYAKEKTCESCGYLVRPPRSRHCNACGHCVAKMDHHCPWINNCVGERNMRWFLLFLAVNTLYSAYGFLFIINIFKDFVVTDPGSRVLLSSHQAPIVLFFVFISLLWFHTGLLLFVATGALGAVVALSYFIFILVNQVLDNVTTSEYFKIKELKKRSQLASNGDDAFAYSSEFRYTDIPVISGPYFHAYNHGSKENFMEMLYPPCTCHGHMSKFD